MNKKLLLILFIFMSLSLFTMSCAKSVTAPDQFVPGVLPGDKITKADIENALKSITSISVGTSKDIIFDFSKGYFQNDGNIFCVNDILNQNNRENPKKSEVLALLIPALQSISDNAVYFSPNQNWDSNSDRYNIYLTVNVSSPLEMPSEMQTIKINLYAFSGSSSANGGGWVE